MGTLPYLTSDLPGIGGAIKLRWQDFVVEEIPLPAPARRGNYAIFEVTKKGLTTPEAVAQIAKYMGVIPRQVGYAGFKDADAVATQFMSLEFPDLARLRRFRNKQLSVGEVSWAAKPLRKGDLAGNRFRVKIRSVGRAQLDPADAIMRVLTSRGVPNYFGPQRFGARSDNAPLGEALVRNDWRRFLEIFLGQPVEADPIDARTARAAFDRGNLPGAQKAWPYHCIVPRKVLSAMMKHQGDRAAVQAVPDHMRRLYVEAFQSLVFNAILAERIARIDEVFDGDLAQDHASGEVFAVDDAASVRPRVEQFAISATGLLPGRGPRLPAGEGGQVEQLVLKRLDVPADLYALGEGTLQAGRRALRYKAYHAELNAGRDRHGEYLEVSFVAAAGCYATALTRELCKNEDD